jgi:hypothetical protein
MYNLRARYYDPSNARFNQMDSFDGNCEDPQSIHKYLYCDSEPINAIDPTGNFEFTLVGQTFTITVQTVLTTLVYSALNGAAIGGAIGAADAAFGGQNFLGILSEAGKGALWGAILGPFGRVRAIAGVLAMIGAAAGLAGSYDSFEHDHWLQGALRLGLGALSIRLAWSSFQEILATKGMWSLGRNPNDIARQIGSPGAPVARTDSTIGTTPEQLKLFRFHLKVLDFLQSLKVVKDVRVNQEQVNANMVRVGRNRPDLQFTLFGIRFYAEYDTPTSPRGPAHRARTLANDQDGATLLIER